MRAHVEVHTLHAHTKAVAAVQRLGPCDIRHDGAVLHIVTAADSREFLCPCAPARDRAPIRSLTPAHTHTPAHGRERRDGAALVQLHDRFIREGKLTIQNGALNFVIFISKGVPAELATLVSCIRACVSTPTRQRIHGPTPTATSTSSGTSSGAAATAVIRSHNREAAASGGCADSMVRGRATRPSAGHPRAPAALGTECLRGLDEEQAAVMRNVVAGTNVFFTGAAGTGKSFVLCKLQEVLPAASTAFTASTGVAACNLRAGAVTLHTWAGVSVRLVAAVRDGRLTITDAADAVVRATEVRRRWQSTNTLVVDEISMIDALTLDIVDAVGQRARGNRNAFGGVQVVLCGDFLQLPPVDRVGVGRAGGPQARVDAVQFAFESAAWERSELTCFQLTKVYRQDDAHWCAMLEELRWGRCSSDTAAALQARYNVERESSEIAKDATSTTEPAARATTTPVPALVATKLCTHRSAVVTINAEQLVKLEGDVIRYECTDAYSKRVPNAEALDALCTAPRVVEYKVGAQVMLNRTIDAAQGLVNGTRGIVIRATSGARHPEVHFANGARVVIAPETWSIDLQGVTVATRRQLPLQLAWAISIHKSQGLSLDDVDVSLSEAFACGQAYVALSRARRLEGIVLREPFNPLVVKAHPRVLEFYRKIFPTGPAIAPTPVKATFSLRSPLAAPHSARALRLVDAANCEADRLRKRAESQEATARELHFAKARRCSAAAVAGPDAACEPENVVM